MQVLAPDSFGFARYGVDYQVPCIVSAKVHDETERNQKERQNQEYMTKYNKMRRN